MADLSYIQATQEVKIVGQDSTGNNANYVSADTHGSIQSGIYDPTGAAITSDNNGNSNKQRLHVAVPDTTAATTALGALNATVSIATAGLASVGFQILAGTLVGTLVPECSVDGGTTWAACSFFDPVNSTVSTSIVFASSNTTKVVSVLPIGGSSNVRVRVSAYTSGTANAVLRASQITGAAGAITAAAFGTVSNTYPTIPGNTVTLILAANPNRKYAAIINNSGSQMNFQLGTGTGLTTSAGYELPARSNYEFKGDNLWTGAIYAISGGTITISIVEGTP